MPPFREIWLVDFEFCGDPGEPPWVLCMVAIELKSGRRIEIWRDELLALREAPFDISPGAVTVAYAAHAELGCFLELGWRLPVNVLDLYAEHRVETNGLRLWNGKKFGNSLLDALTIRNLAHIDASEKEEMRRLILDRRPRSWVPDEQRAILHYCSQDVNALAALLPVMAPTIDWPRAGLRGRYCAAIARMERTGTPIDALLWRRLVGSWDALRIRMTTDIDRAYGVYDEASFRVDRFDKYLASNDIPWPRHPSGMLVLDKETFDDQAAEMMRIAAIAATEAGLKVCCPVHDAFVIAAPIERIEADTAAMREIMAKASKVVTGGLEVRTDAEIVAWPDRYMDDRGGQVMWDLVMRHLEQLEATAADRGADAA